MPDARVILHVDMDAFYASVEVLDDPTLRGRPLLVGHPGGRGVVTTASYEARAFGCRSAMPMSQAMRLCPQAVVVRPRFERYHELSERVFGCVGRFTPLYEPLSIDEAFLDCTASVRLLGDGPTMAAELKRMILKSTGLTASVGVSHNKFLAKLASDLAKPDGLTVIWPDDVPRLLPPLPVGRLWGIGQVTAARLECVGVRTVADLLARDRSFFVEHFGRLAARMYRLCLGQDDRPVVPDSSARSIGHEQTFGQDLEHPEAARDVLVAQCEKVAARLRRGNRFATLLTLKLRDGQFRTVTRRRPLDPATNLTRDLIDSARAIFDSWAVGSFKPLRLIGVSVGGLTAQPQPGLFDQPTRERQRRVDQALDRIRGRFGPSTIARGLCPER